jgi:hypothetical protein
MDMRRRRSSSSISLVLISASALTACGQSSPPGADTLRRDVYTSQADCMKDWGADPAKCEPRKSGSGTSSYTHYYGPGYHHGSYGSSNAAHGAGSTTEARPGSRATGTAHVSRSGFGSSASSHGSSGSHGAGS